MLTNDPSTKYKWIKLYAYLDDGYLLWSIHKDLHKKKHNCHRVPSKDTQVVLEDIEGN